MTQKIEHEDENEDEDEVHGQGGRSPVLISLRIGWRGVEVNGLEIHGLPTFFDRPDGQDSLPTGQFDCANTDRLKVCVTAGDGRRATKGLARD